ncbi:MAG: hypothetical protein CVV22_00685 [Ignavibacteriae bacterium HGW-Ignavibacteriae-1]|jgi:mono/diheme cytochrome c family protein|nr:MAG: hypothetical protein CVV22_00685 [Ignavibacteriae bacterium HGW-Ignavibacteriae-1]
MENKFRPEDEINYKDFLKNPLRLFAVVYPYLIMLIIVVGMYWVFNLDNAYLNTQQKQLLARDTVAPEIPMQKGAMMEGVNVKEISVPSAEMIAKGAELYKANCSSCHGNEGKGDGIAGAGLNPKPRNFTDLQGWKNGAQLSHMWKTLEEGIPGTGMVAYNYLTVVDRFALIHYMHSLMPDFPKDSDSDLEALDLAYSLSEGKVTSNQISVSMAMTKMNEEYGNNKTKIEQLTNELNTVEGEIATLLDKVISNKERASVTLVHGKIWQNGTDAFIQEISSTINDNGFTPTTLRLTKDELTTLHSFLLNARNRLNLQSQS